MPTFFGHSLPFAPRIESVALCRLRHRGDTVNRTETNTCQHGLRQNASTPLPPVWTTTS